MVQPPSSLTFNVVVPMQWAQIRNMIAAAIGYGDNMVYFPTILGFSVSIIVPANPATKGIFSVKPWMVSENACSLLPDQNKFRVTQVHKREN